MALPRLRGRAAAEPDPRADHARGLPARGRGDPQGRAHPAHDGALPEVPSSHAGTAGPRRGGDESVRDAAPALQSQAARRDLLRARATRVQVGLRVARADQQAADRRVAEHQDRRDRRYPQPGAELPEPGRPRSRRAQHRVASVLQRTSGRAPNRPAADRQWPPAHRPRRCVTPRAATSTTPRRS